MNCDSGLKYKSQFTPKYLKVSCENCSKFQVWFKNIRDTAMADIPPKHNLDVRLFRVINRNHIRQAHPEVKL